MYGDLAQRHWKHFQSGAPQGRDNISVCKCVFVARWAVFVWMGEWKA